jgi:hypothetical protein
MRCLPITVFCQEARRTGMPSSLYVECCEVRDMTEYTMSKSASREIDVCIQQCHVCDDVRRSRNCEVLWSMSPMPMHPRMRWMCDTKAGEACVCLLMM